MKQKVFRSIEAFEEYYLPKYCEKYPIRMRVNEEEAQHIKFHRGENWEATNDRDK